MLADDEALELGRWYAVSVWIDTERRGVPPENVEHPIEEPGHAATVRLVVLATSGDFEIDEPVQTLILPAQGASIGRAVFRVRPLAPRPDPGELRFHVLYSLNLIEDILLVARGWIGTRQHRPCARLPSAPLRPDRGVRARRCTAAEADARPCEPQGRSVRVLLRDRGREPALGVQRQGAARLDADTLAWGPIKISARRSSASRCRNGIRLRAGLRARLRPTRRSHSGSPVRAGTCGRGCSLATPRRRCARSAVAGGPSSRPRGAHPGDGR